MTLERPIKSVLEDGPVDAAVARGWSRIQRKRRVRDNARKALLAVSCLALAGAVGFQLRPLFTQRATLDTAVKDLPHAPAARGRTQPVQRPVPPPPAPVVEAPVPLPEPEVDVVAALLESVSDAYSHGDMGRATALLQEIAQKHEDDARCAQALYVLGLIQLERHKDKKSAADSFTRALELSPPPQLVAPLWQALERARAE